jgi:hypothetical protein
VKILFIFSSPVSLEVFLNSGIIEKLKSKSDIQDVRIAIRKNNGRLSPDKEKLNNQDFKVKEFIASSTQDRYFSIMRDFALVKKRKIFIAFSKRLSRKFYGNFQSRYLGSKAPITYAKINLKNPYNLLLLLAFVPVLSTLIVSFLKIIYPYPGEIEDIYRDFYPDRVFLMSSGDDPCLFEIPLVAKKLGFNWDLIVDNWDNLSSKTIFWNKPNHIYVWGKDHSYYAKKWHGFQPSQIFEIGTPRINFPKKNLKKRNLNNHILYIGMQKPYDEISDLEVILDFCSTNKCTLIYRPHPMKKFSAIEKKQIKSLAENKNFHINISENFRDYFSNASLAEVSRPDEFTNLDKESLMSINFRNIIATPGSLALEALVYDKPIIVMARNDGIYKTTASIAWDSYPWFSPLKKMNAVQVARSYSDLILMLHAKKFEIFDEQSSKIIKKEICRHGKENWAAALISTILYS